MSLIRKHGAVLQAWACLALVIIVVIMYTELYVLAKRISVYFRKVLLENCVKVVCRH